MKKLFMRWHNLPAPTKSSLAFMLSSMLITGLNFITTPVFTHLIDQSRYGLVSIYYSWLSIIDVIALLGLTSAGVFNVGMNEYKESRSKYISSIIGLCNVITLLVFGVIFVIKHFVGEDFMLPTSLLVLMLIHFIFSPANVFWVTREKYEYRYKASALITVLSSLGSLGISILFVALFKSSDKISEIRLWSAEIVMLLFYIPIYLYLIFKGKNYINLTVWKQTLLFALPLLPHYLAQHVMASADTIMIERLVSDADAAIYSVVAMIGKVATIVWAAINVSLIAITFEAMNEKKYEKLRGLTLTLVLMYGAVCIAITLAAPELLKIFAPENYAKGVYIVPPIAAVSFLSALYNIYGNVEFYHKKSFGIALATVVSALANIALNLILIPKFSYIGAAYTTLISNIILIVMHYIGYRRASADRIYNDRALFIVAAVITAITVAATALYVNTAVRYVIIGIIVLAAAVKHRAIIEKIKALYSKGEQTDI
ncbi:MAG: oligosaccharide flippase family protein [Clostridia bacterium]|nr:oligosaccharide flippase family protein [Clostridia bacterium]